MKVGVLTCHSSLNYGANLQLFATVRSLEKLGHDVYVYDNRDSSENTCRSFVVREFRLTNMCRSDEDFRSETLRLAIELIIVGSDAVLWFLLGKKEGHGAYPNPFWLRWAKELPVRRVLLAGSCMGLMFPLKCGSVLRAQLRQDIATFDYVSVRDHWTLSFVRWLGVRGADLVYDPTVKLPDLFQPDVSALPVGLERGKYIVLTFSSVKEDDDWLEALTNEAHKFGFKTCFIPHPDRLCGAEHVDCLIEEVLDPLRWLSILGCAAGYVGERFHPVVLSAFYGIPFVACDYYSYSGYRGILNKRSKTRDFCKRIGALSDVHVANGFFKKVTPEEVVRRVLVGCKNSLSGRGIGFDEVLGKAIK